MLVAERLDFQALARTVAEASGASRVLLFGSMARGDNTVDSDTDLLLVFDDHLSMAEVTERLIAADTATLPRKFALDLVPMLSHDYFERQSVLSRAIHREGRLLYAR